MFYVLYKLKLTLIVLIPIPIIIFSTNILKILKILFEVTNFFFKLLRSRAYVGMNIVQIFSERIYKPKIQ